MEIFKAQSLAYRLMKEHGLFDKGWMFSFDNAKTRFGCCKYTDKIITLSKPLTLLRDEKNVRNTILHEIAHAIVGYGHGHNHVWKRKAIEIGCTGDRCSGDVVLEGKWVGMCPQGHVHYRHKQPSKKRRQSCGICLPNKFDAKYLITYTKSK